jgi:hypothetical protein
MNPALRPGEVVSETDIDLLDQRTDMPMPTQLRSFYLEMGDGFEFVPHNAAASGLEGWERNWLSDYAIWNAGFFTPIEEEVSGEITAAHLRVDPQLLQEKAERRKQWVPFYGFVGGGDVLCLDSEGKVRFYEALNWRASPTTWNFVRADSLSDLAHKWSRYCFVAPGCGWTSFCFGHSGAFDWSPSRFPRGIPCGNLGART